MKMRLVALGLGGGRDVAVRARRPPSLGRRPGRSPWPRPTASARSAARRAGPCRRRSSRSVLSLICASRSRTSRAAATTSFQPVPGPGIEVEDQPVGLVEVLDRCEPRVWISSTPACTSEISPSRSSIEMILSPFSATRCRCSGLMPALACFWKKHCPRGAVGAAHQRDRPADEMRRASSSTPAT